jgi:hypothetical protein
MDPSGSRARGRYEEDTDDDLVYGDEYFDDYYETRNRTRTRDREDEYTQDRGRNKTMSSWLQRQLGSQQAQLTAAAVLSGAAVAGTILGYQALKRREAVEELKSSIPRISEKHRAQKVRWTKCYYCTGNFEMID